MFPRFVKTTVLQNMHKRFVHRRRLDHRPPLIFNKNKKDEKGEKKDGEDKNKNKFDESKKEFIAWVLSFLLFSLISKTPGQDLLEIEVRVAADSDNDY